MEAARDILHELQSLAEQLAAEPFCHKYQLERQALAKVSLFIEQRETSLERVAPVQEDLKESFRKFKAIYCLFLMHLESGGEPLDAARLNKITLADYLSLQTRESLGLVQPPAQSIDGDEPTQIGKVFSMPARDEDRGTDVTMVGEIINYVGQEAGAQEQSTPAPEIAAPSPEVEAPVQDETPVTWESPSEQADMVVEHQDAGELTGEVSSGPQGPTHSVAQEYYATAIYFRSQREAGQKMIPETHLTRLEGQQTCFALEVEFQEKLAPLVAKFWAQRKQMIDALWDPNSPKGDFHPALVQAWENLVQDSTVWPTQERLPVLTFKNSLRFIGSAPDPGPSKPALLEAGLWVYLFGQDCSFDGVTLQNVLGLPALPYEEIAVAFMRLCRAHRLKATLQNPSLPFGEAEREELHAIAGELFKFVRSWHGE